MILEILTIGLIISACLALFLDDAVYSVAALAATFLFTALIYALDGAVFAAIFQFAVGVGTLTILFLSGELLSERAVKKTSSSKAFGLIGAGVVLSLPALFLSISGATSAGVSINFGDALWSLNGMDVILQGLVILTVALGIVIVLYERRNSGK
ncbi:MAG TPA: NADH-quinone oxidoreductase subunit J [Candidatus Limnocylindrales bacterium]|nr:NADH-quinone oxidoreductase subunit J [Candidatus Limnocylindrales bacterium]